VICLVNKKGGIQYSIIGFLILGIIAVVLIIIFGLGLLNSTTQSAGNVAGGFENILNNKLNTP